MPAITGAAFFTIAIAAISGTAASAIDIDIDFAVEAVKFAIATREPHNRRPGLRRPPFGFVFLKIQTTLPPDISISVLSLARRYTSAESGARSGKKSTETYDIFGGKVTEHLIPQFLGGDGVLFTAT